MNSIILNKTLKHGSSTYDVHGNMLTMPHLSSMVWDFADRLQSAGNGTFTSYYNYDSTGNRSRKIVEKSNIREERYYLGGYEVFRKYLNGDLDLERQTLHIDDDNKKVAFIETKTKEDGDPVSPLEITIRYQYDNHLGSACLELDEDAEIISYEEYHPFGTTSYRSGRTETEVSLKRYKYVGKERDEETGLYYYGARYYAAWLCRFVSVDPLQHDYPQLTPFNYAGNKPITHYDIDGMQATGDYAAKGSINFEQPLKPITPQTSATAPPTMLKGITVTAEKPKTNPENSSNVTGPAVTGPFGYEKQMTHNPGDNMLEFLGKAAGNVIISNINTVYYIANIADNPKGTFNDLLTDVGNTVRGTVEGAGEFLKNPVSTIASYADPNKLQGILNSMFLAKGMSVVGSGLKSSFSNVTKSINTATTTETGIVGGNLGAGRTSVKQWLQKAGNLERDQLIQDIEGAGFKKVLNDKEMMHFDRGRMKIRLDPPQKDTPFNHMHLNYKGNKGTYDINLNKVYFKDPAAHIRIK